MAKKINYLNNKDFLLEIHRSKTNFCEFVDFKYSDFDAILATKESLFDTQTIIEETNLVSRDHIIRTAKENRANRINANRIKDEQSKTDEKITKRNIELVQPEDIDTKDLVFRFTTYEHIPLEEGRKKNPKRVADFRAKVNFHPFKHYILNDDLTELIEVGRSHSKDGKFSVNHTKMTNKLAHMFMLLVERYAQMPNWRNYTYNDEMKGYAIMQLTQMGLLFNEAKGSNPFCYCSCIVEMAFTKVLNSEKRVQDIRDDLLIQAGQNPSMSRQLQYDDYVKIERELLGDD